MRYLLDKGEEIVGVLTIEDPDEEKWSESLLKFAKSRGQKTFVPKSTKDPAFIESVNSLGAEVLFSII